MGYCRNECATLTKILKPMLADQVFVDTYLLILHLLDDPLLYFYCTKYLLMQYHNAFFILYKDNYLLSMASCVF